VLLTSTLALLVAWSVAFDATSITGRPAGRRDGGRRARHPPAAAPAVASAVSNSGFWSIPVAGALFGPAGAAFAVLYDVVSARRGLLVTRTLRAYAPSRPCGRSAAVEEPWVNRPGPFGALIA